MNDKRKISSDFDVALFQDRLKKAMKDKGFTNASFAEAIGISEPALISYKRNNEPSIPSIDKVVTMAKHLDVSIDYLCSREEAKQVDFSKKTEKQDNDKLKEIFKAVRYLIDNLNVTLGITEDIYDGDVYRNDTTLTFTDRDGKLYDYISKYLKIRNLIKENFDILQDSEMALINNIENSLSCKYNELTKDISRLEVTDLSQEEWDDLIIIHDEETPF